MRFFHRWRHGGEREGVERGGQRGSELRYQQLVSSFTAPIHHSPLPVTIHHSHLPFTIYHFHLPFTTPIHHSPLSFTIHHFYSLQAFLFTTKNYHHKHKVLQKPTTSHTTPHHTTPNHTTPHHQHPHGPERQQL